MPPDLDVPLPACLPDPFAPDAALQPAPSALSAAMTALLADVEAGRAGPTDGWSALWQPAAMAGGAGKMFGVLLAKRGTDASTSTSAAAARTPEAPELMVLRAFSGTWAGAWEHPGFVGPVFDVRARASWWPAAEAALTVINEAHAALLACPEAARAQAHLTAVEEHAAVTLAQLRATHATRKAARDRLRTALGEQPPEFAAATRATLDQQSRADKAELRSARATMAHQVATAAAPVQVWRNAIAALEARRVSDSRTNMQRLHDEYQFRNQVGEVASLRTLFAPGEPPAGAGDCAGTKLIAHAVTHGLVPLALAEFWIGAPPLQEGRHHGHRYAPCRGRCGRILPFLLAGSGVDMAHAPQPLAPRSAVVHVPTASAAPNMTRITRGTPLPTDGETVRLPTPSVASRGNVSSSSRALQPLLRIVFQDPWICVVDKPAGMLAVPGRSPHARMDVATALIAQGCAGPWWVAHRLDEDTQGLLVLSRDATTHQRLQASFANRAVTKLYHGILAGPLPPAYGAAGDINVAMRPDPFDRPRQLVDPNGKTAHTHWQRLPATAATHAIGTALRLYPKTGRTHQLRVHAAHPTGLGLALYGDRLYGQPAPRGLALRAVAMRLPHPHHGTPLTLLTEGLWDLPAPSAVDLDPPTLT